MSGSGEGRYPCDLHCHTTRSDGNDTPLELVANALRIGLRAIAITDHDIEPPRTMALPDGREVECVAYAAERGLTLVPGYEFSCDTWVDDVHICGYGLDWERPALREEVAAAKRSKSDAYAELCRRLAALGMPVDWEGELLAYTDVNGRPARRDPDEVQRKHVFEVMAAKGYAATWSEAKIRVQDNPDLNVRRRKIDPVAAISLIHRCGGVAVLAHPYLIGEEVAVDGGGRSVGRAAYIDRLVEAGLDGIEASYPYDKTSYKGELSPEAIEAEVRAAYGHRLRFISGGSDYHADHRKGSRKARGLGERGVSVEAFRDFFS
jgi:predicted metal-dependent phosphoesterase TrpH